MCVHFTLPWSTAPAHISSSCTWDCSSGGSHPLARTHSFLGQADVFVIWMSFAFRHKATASDLGARICEHILQSPPNNATSLIMDRKFSMRRHSSSDQALRPIWIGNFMARRASRALQFPLRAAIQSSSFSRNWEVDDCTFICILLYKLHSRACADWDLMNSEHV